MSEYKSLGWFKSIKEMFSPKKKKEETSAEQPVPGIIAPVYIRRKMVNDVLTVLLPDGEILIKQGATIDDWNKVEECTSRYALDIVMSSNEVAQERKEKQEEIENITTLKKVFPLLEKVKDFIIEENNVVYLKAENGQKINRSIPVLLVEKFSRVVNNFVNNDEHIKEELYEDVEYQSLKKFWMKCCLNPNAQSAEDLYTFLEKHQFKIDRHGNFYAYRRVVSKSDENKEFVEFVSNAYTKVKAIWKQKPSNFYIKSTDEGYTISKNNDNDGISSVIGNLDELYKSLPTLLENSYTSAHTGLEDYKIGQVISMPRNDCDENNQISCSRGYHQASKMYDYSGFGDTPILTIVNPMDTIAVPLGEVGKLRVCRWFFACTLTEDEKYILDDDDFDVTDLGDVFEEMCLADLEEHIKQGFAEEVKRHTFTLPTLNSSDVDNIVISLNDMKKAIEKRVVKIND